MVSTEITRATSTPAATTYPFALQTSQALYIGLPYKFAHRFFKLGTVNSVAATLSVHYWNGSAWTAVKDLIDQTVGFTESGFISWVNEEDWEKHALSPITDVELFWIRITTGTNLHASTTLQWVGNIFCDDSMLRREYPELVSDSRWLPPDRSDFLEQYISGKDLVVLRLKQDGIIEDESQLIDPNEVANAATLASAYAIVKGAARTEEEREWAKSIEDDFNNELNKVKLDLDWNNDGIIEEVEKDTGNVFIPRGGY